MGTLYLVATPIGNLEDISLRALRVLGEVGLVAAEDTRRTRALLSHYKLHTPLASYHEHNKWEQIPRLLQALAESDVALVSDAGTPGLNDPGYELVQAAVQAGFQVSPIPGPSAPIAALSASGLPAGRFLYLGYLPRKAGDRRSLLSELARLPYTLVFLETPHRLLACLDDLQAVLGERQVAIARELTKLHEEIFHGSLAAARQHFAGREVRGEFTLVVAEEEPQPSAWPETRLVSAIQERLGRGESPSQVAASLALEAGWPRRAVYRLLVQQDRSERVK